MFNFLNKLKSHFTKAAEPKEPEVLMVKLPFTTLQTITDHIQGGENMPDILACSDRWDETAQLVRNSPYGRIERLTINSLAKSIEMIAEDIRKNADMENIIVRRYPIQTITENRGVFALIAKEYATNKEEFTNVVRFQPKSGVPIAEHLLPFNRNLQDAEKVATFINKFAQHFINQTYDPKQQDKLRRANVSVGMPRGGRH